MNILAKHSGLKMLARGKIHFFMNLTRYRIKGDTLFHKSEIHSIFNLPPKPVQDNEKDILYQIKHIGQKNSHLNEMNTICQI